MKLQELKEPFHLYIEDPYGNGFDTTPVKRGDVLPDNDGQDFEFIGITPDGLKIVGHSKDVIVKVSPKQLSGIIKAGKPEGPGFSKKDSK